MDYDNSMISTVYDEARGLSAEGLDLWLGLVARDASPVEGCLLSTWAAALVDFLSRWLSALRRKSSPSIRRRKCSR